MALKAIWIPNISYVPQEDRLALRAFLAPAGTDQTSFLSVRAGVIPAPAASTGGPLRVIPGGALTVNVNIGQIVIQAGAALGAYIVTNDSSLNIALPVAHASLARIDVVYVLVSDTSNGGGSDSVTITSATGTPAASPVAPTLPTGAVEIGRVNVTAGLTTVVTGNIVDTRVFTGTAGQALQVPSTAKPTYGIPGQRLWLTDTGAEQYWDGTVWQPTGVVIGGAPPASAGWSSGLQAARPASPALGTRYYATDTKIEWVYLNIGGTNYWTPPTGAIVAKGNSAFLSTATGVAEIIPYTTRDIDLLSGWTTPFQNYLPPLPGYYEFTLGSTWTVPAASNYYKRMDLILNGGSAIPGGSSVGQAGSVKTEPIFVSAVVRLNGSTDYIYTAATQNSGTGVNAQGILTVTYLGQ